MKGRRFGACLETIAAAIEGICGAVASVGKPSLALAPSLTLLLARPTANGSTAPSLRCGRKMTSALSLRGLGESFRLGAGLRLLTILECGDRLGDVRLNFRQLAERQCLEIVISH